MTAETDLLPLPALEPELENLPPGLKGFIYMYARDYARANLAELQREVEGLRAEVAGLTAQVEHHTAYTVIHRGALRYCNSTMRDAYSDEHHRAERLAEALRFMVGASYVVCTTIDPRGHRWSEAYLDQALPGARAALGQETTNG